ncbi:nucleolar protein 6 [Topomyia yanbarensis]|uniref:nucleolar protein 6 n=1 Tax=Topomyia yanbarensis TaxID=2498891 RepID=UPI00273C5567|nr:nucleolar protein 6 [Topomyia yanbarensis]
MKKVFSKKRKASKLTAIEEPDYDSMVEDGTDEGSEENYASKQEISDIDSGHESAGGRFVRALPRDVKPKKAKKLKASESDEKHQLKIKALKELYKPPTVEEINRLKETDNFYHSNLFRLQVEEMLRELKVKTKVTNYVERWLDDFRKFLRTLKDAETERSLEDVSYEAVSFPLTFPDNSDFLSREGFKFAQQRIVHQIGSARLGTSYGKVLAVDLLLEIPNKCFRSEDYLNMRYHYKRAHFLCHLAEGLAKQSKYQLVGKVKFVPLKGDALKPVLEVTPAEDKFSNRVCFIIHAASIGKFSPKRFLPDKNNVRPAVIGKDTSMDSGLCPTPHYNTSILYDMCLLKNQEMLESILQSDHVRQAIILLKVWLHQRRFNEGYYGFDGAVATFFIAHLMRARKIYNTMSSYQIIRLFWNQLANSHWDTAGISLEANVTNDLISYHKCFDVVFLGNSEMLNICANMSGDLYRRVREEASVAIQLLDNQKLNSFIALFLNKFPVYTQYDHILSIEKPDLIQSVIETFGTDSDKLNYFGNSYAHFRKMVHELLRQGLGQRVRFIVPIQIHHKNQLCLSFGILLNAHEAFSVVDKGPEAIDKPASDDYRNFWRGKSELRRFKDGSITESCVWGSSTDPIGQKRLICRKIALYLLNSHYDITETKLTYSAHQFEVSVKPDGSELHETVEERSLACIRAFDNLSRIMKKLDDLPLTINSLVGTDAVFRYADPDPPRATVKAILVNGQLMFLASHVINATIQLEASGKWPEQLEAIQRLKAAFYLKIADSIRVYAGATTELVPQAYADYLDVMYEKYLFRFHIVHQREITLLREYLADNQVTKLYRDSDRSKQLEMQATILPKLTSILHGLHQQHFSFGSVAAMAKRWLYAQLIDPFLWPDECTELLVAAMYEKQCSTLQPQAGFLRFLEYLANTDWTKELILLNFNEEIPEEKVEELEKQFIHRRDSFPPLAIVTSCDADKFGLFSRRAPSQEVLGRVTFLAKNVVSIIEQNFSVIRTRVHIFYKPSYDGYDLIIHLEGSIVPAVGITSIDNYTQGKRAKLLEDETKNPAAGFNPVQFYLSELREGYRKYAVFFYDHCEGDRIAVLWRPDAMGEKPFTTTNVNGRLLSKEKSLILNTEAIIRDFEILGKGLVRSIERK